MIISRILAKRHIAAGRRPSRRAAWVPVLVDCLLVGLLAIALWQPALTFVYVMDFSLPVTILFLFIVIYLPVQLVIIVSTIWAVRARWVGLNDS
ncbi:hypothetical protein ACJ5NV_10520 [Loktanella agnita]|uniref:hypothetical protein n=1 Tax=Loktanella agnita TaxID=287097 RepID=UPI003986A2E3